MSDSIWGSRLTSGGLFDGRTSSGRHARLRPPLRTLGRRSRAKATMLFGVVADCAGTGWRKVLKNYTLPTHRTHPVYRLMAGLVAVWTCPDFVER
jgi:hypothetical protein